MMLILKSILNIQLRHYMRRNSRIQILKDAFGLNVDEASKFLRTITRTDPDSFLASIKMCKELGFTDEDILSSPKILNLTPMTIEQEFMILQEGGFEKIIPHVLLQYSSLRHKKVVELKLTNYIPEDINVAKSFSSYFDPKPEDGVIDFNQFDEVDKWKDIHSTVIKLYLGWRLRATEEEIQKIFRIHPFVRNKSIRYLCENIRLALQAGLSLRRIKTSGYILHGYPKYTKEVLRDYSHIAGGDLKKAIMGCPKLLMVSPEKYARIYGLLKKHGISDETIRNNLNVFQYAPQTIQYRLEEIDKSPELSILKHNNKFLSLIVHHQRAKSRMCYLQELKMRCLPLKVLALRNRIDNHVLSGVDVNDPKEVLNFFKILLKCDERHIKKELKKHPHFCAVPLYEIQGNYDYLKSIKFTDEAIRKVPTILLYPKDSTKEKLMSIKSDPSFKQAERQVDRLNYLLYNLEKKFDFTGEGIWPKQIPEEIDKNQ